MIEGVSKTNSFEAYLQPVVASVSPALISPSAFSDINSVARVLPVTLAYDTFGFECRLGEEPPGGLLGGRQKSVLWTG